MHVVPPIFPVSPNDAEHSKHVTCVDDLTY